MKVFLTTVASIACALLSMFYMVSTYPVILDESNFTTNIISAFVAYVAVIVIHEFGHAVPIRQFNYKIADTSISFFFFKLDYNFEHKKLEMSRCDGRSYVGMYEDDVLDCSLYKFFIISAGGPLATLISGVLFYMFISQGLYESIFALRFYYAASFLSVALLVYNVLPTIEGTDGWKMKTCITNLKRGNTHVKHCPEFTEDH